MARTLTDAQTKIAMAWIHDVLVWGGVLKKPKRAVPAKSYYHMYGGNGSVKNNQKYLSAVKTICDSIKLRKVETQFMQAIDAATNTLSVLRFNPDLASQSWWESVTKSPDMLCRYIAWFCRTNELWWDNSATTTFEMDQIQNHTTIGAALYSEHCFSVPTAADGSVKTAKTASSSTSSTRAASSGVPGQPQNSFKSRGPLSNVCIDLKSTPNHKEQLQGDVYVILGTDANGNFMEDCAYIRPVEADTRIQQNYVINGTNKVLFGSAKGYGYCPCTFASNTEADAFLVLLKQNVKPGKAADMKVGKKKAQGNGYFKVGTQYGDCYISAAKLNEDLKEELTINECGISGEIQEQLDEMIREDTQFEKDFLSY